MINCRASATQMSVIFGLVLIDKEYMSVKGLDFIVGVVGSTGWTIPKQGVDWSFPKICVI